MAKLVPTKVVATFEEAMRGIVVAKYKELVVQLLKTGWRWQDTTLDGTDVFLLDYSGDVYVMTIDLVSMKLSGRDEITAIYFEQEVCEMVAYKQLKEASELWTKFRSQYWDF